MRRSLQVHTLAVSLLIIIAFVVPLGLLVRRQASDRAQVAGERLAQQVAASLAVAATKGSLDHAAAEAAVAASGSHAVTVLLPDGTVSGPAVPFSVAIEGARSTGSAGVAAAHGGWEVAIPVILREGTAVVRVLVTREELTRGVTVAWLMLAGLAVVLLLGAMLVSARLGRSFVEPVGDLARTARRLGAGDLSARAHGGGPAEVREVGAALNELAARLAGMLAAERESVADLSHRLRTPLTALRLQAERLVPSDRDLVIGHVDRLEAAVSRLITQARSRGADDVAVQTDLAALVQHRTNFWRVLAEEQSRVMEVEVPDSVVAVAADRDELTAAVDALIGNVFAHTPPGCGLRLTVRRTAPRGAILEVSDNGPGFPAGLEVLARGESGGASTGLGLDIVRRLAEQTGGGIELGDSGGARVTVRLGG